MKKFIAKIISWPWQRSMSIEEKYLAQSTDLVDLERRQKQLRYGTAPIHTVNVNLRGWV